MKIGSLEIKRARFGNTEITKMYLGSLLVYQKTEEGLPARYQKVAYLESTGVQYLVFNWKINFTSLELSCDFEPTVSATKMTAFGTQGSATKPYYPVSLLLRLQTDGNFTLLAKGNISQIAIDTYVANERKKLKVIASTSGKQIYVNDELKASNNLDCSIVNETGTGTAYNIFSEGGAYGVNRYPFIGKIYSFSLKANNSMVANLVPCYDTENGNKPGMYDLVSRQFLVNQRTGADFIVGPDVHDLPAEFQEVEYLQGDGNAWIEVNETYGKYVHDIKFENLTNVNLIGFNTSGGCYWGSSSNNQFRISGSNETTGLDATQRQIVEVNFTQTRTSLTASGQTIYRDIIRTLTNSYHLFYIYGYSGNNILYNFKYYDLNNTLKHHYIPCYNKTTLVAGMYDLITKQFKTNSGTGSFIVGPDIN